MTMEQTSTLTRLTMEQRRQWDAEGYLVIKNALSPTEVAELTAAVDRLDAESQAEGRDPNAFLSALNVVERDDVFLNLVDHSSHLGIVVDLLGANIQMKLSQVMVRPPTPTPGSRWHVDGPGPYPFPNLNGVMPLIQLKIGWFLTDVDNPDMGNFVVIPGSHANGLPPSAVQAIAASQQAAQIEIAVPGARQVMVRAGDALLFHQGVWHAVAHNASNVRRKNLYYVYSPLWMRLVDRFQTSPEILARSNPVRRQLLGDLITPGSSMFPSDETAPLMRLFEGKTYQELQKASAAQYLRLAQR